MGLNGSVPIVEIFPWDGESHVKWQRYLKTVFISAADNAYLYRFLTNDDPKSKKKCGKKWSQSQSTLISLSLIWVIFSIYLSSDLKIWKNGDKVSGLPNRQVSGAVIVTRLMKTLRALESDADRSLTRIRRELLILELGYVLLLYRTKRNVIDIMVPHHKVRLD